MEFIKIADCEIGQEIIAYFAVKESTIKTAANGSAYLDLNLFDGVTAFNAKMWDIQDSLKPEPNKVIELSARIGEFRGRKQATCLDWRVVDVDIEHFLPQTDKDINELWTYINGEVNGIEDYDLRDMVQAILGKYEEEIKLAPAATFHHHAYIGGLLEHTASVLSIALAISTATNTCNKDMLIAGAVLHDIGKISELDCSTIDFSYTSEGSLLGHATLGNMIIRKFASDRITVEQLTVLSHIIASHHGKLEWGASVEPACEEAIIVHTADHLDAQLWKIKHHISETEPESHWTERVYGPNKKFLLTDKYLSDGWFKIK